MLAAQVAAFNAALLQVLGFIQQRFPDDRGVSIAKVKAAMSISPREPCSVFVQAVLPFEPHICRATTSFSWPCRWRLIL
ncbi:hypothetical protein BC828DRAFT_382218 [Blastocladiella britannica]|nr:hypothetical protein BC828DRAFT_382218 [Blastocladiella britannica]